MRITRRVAGVAAVAVTGVALSGFTSPSFADPVGHRTDTTITSTGLAPGQIKHVWLIILENKSYDATFTGLNQNSYLWKTLPSQGALLKNYYGTGHYSQDNYTSLVSGQSPSMDLQEDCDVANTDLGTNANIIAAHTGARFGRTDQYGQVLSPAGPNAPDGKNGCTFPKHVPTLFNQLDAANVSWKGYAQDLGNQPGREDGLGGAPGSRANTPTTNPRVMAPTAADKAAGITSFTGAQANDQYVAKHFPFAWFHSIVGDDNTGTDALTTPVGGGTDTDAAHIANLDHATGGLIADLEKPADQVPAFSWITPNNCSDAHDATCKGNNLSGLFDANGNPDYSKPLSTPPVNHTGGLYASDLFLKYYVPLIERSAAFKDGGLIDITFDEANPPFSTMSFNNATDPTRVAKAAAKHEIYQYKSPTMKSMAGGYVRYGDNQFPAGGALAQDYLKADRAGQNINGKNVPWEPTGPNSTLATDRYGNQLYPGPGNNGYIVRPPSCEQDLALVNADKTNCVPGAKNTGSDYGLSPAKTITASAGAATSTIAANVVTTDIGRAVTGAGIPSGSYIGAVVNAGPVMVSDPTQPVSKGSFTLVDARGKKVTTTGPVTSITLSALGVPGHLSPGQTPAAAFDARTPTPGGGITGSVLISPAIKPGTVSTTSYNHYSWLRTMEDIFSVSSGQAYEPLTAGTISGGLDKLGHLGFAAQSGLMPFGRDVFTAAATTKGHGGQ
ncbi:alkaline phosphatase family protein [Arsenicicoccus piscis]|uniref:alkaline phosphatase family protein n=1 Tax=Arsenicicoccus piscis TaxID=673954 RepID=UPI001F4C6F3B|nr:alkaline phosphatase family protein [Arsenicicoccus piscis]MCH8626404.1 alkaline phosphatase family protein [Arsenicicoccus piscis]